MADIGYARVSTTDQNLDLQVDALAAAGCARRDIYTDKASGTLADRPGLAKCLRRLEDGDRLTVWKLDRLGRSVRHLVETVSGLDARGVQFRSLSEGLDTSTNGGRLVFHIFAALAEFERGLIVERTQAGLAAAKARGRTGGRPLSLAPEQRRLARRLHGEGHNVAQIARMLGTSRGTVYRTLESAVSATALRTGISPGRPGVAESSVNGRPAKAAARPIRSLVHGHTGTSASARVSRTNTT